MRIISARVFVSLALKINIECNKKVVGHHHAHTVTTILRAHVLCPLESRVNFTSSRSRAPHRVYIAYKDDSHIVILHIRLFYNVLAHFILCMLRAIWIIRYRAPTYIDARGYKVIERIHECINIFMYFLARDASNISWSFFNLGENKASVGGEYRASIY